jgi:putative addiction module killer protein
VGGGVFELKTDFGPGYRIYFGKDGGWIVILLGGSSKKRQDTAIRAAPGGLGRVQAAQGRQGVITWH